MILVFPHPFNCSLLCLINQEDITAEEEARAVVEGRFLSMRAHARELGVGQPSRILATGGGSKNPEVCTAKMVHAGILLTGSS